MRERSASIVFFFFQAEDGIRDLTVTGVQTCALPISQQLRIDNEYVHLAWRREKEELRNLPFPMLADVKREHREGEIPELLLLDRKSTRLNSSHSQISYAVFCLKKKQRADDITHFPVPARPGTTSRV